MLLQPRNRCMQDARLSSYEKHVSVHKHVYTNKFIMITFPEKFSMGTLICVAKRCMENIFVYKAKIFHLNRDVI